jgi:hypothetical protein
MLALLIDLLGFVASGLLFLVLVLLIRGPIRRFKLLFAYVTWEFLASLALTVADKLYNGSGTLTPNSSSSLHPQQGQVQFLYSHIYWTNDVLVDLFRFLVVITFTYRAVANGPMRTALGRLLAGLMLVVIGLPFVLYHPRFTPWPQNTWFNSTSQLLNFGAAIMNLVLWGTLIASKQRDRQLLTVSAGLGVVVTGAAISYGLRYFIPLGAFRTVYQVSLMLTQIAGWLIWCRAFWPAKVLRSAPSGALTST